jgi:hypothetical protein
MANGKAHRGEVEVIEDVTTRFPYGSAAVLLLTLLSIRVSDSGGKYRTGGRTIESVYLRYLPTLVVSAQQRDLIGVP